MNPCLAKELRPLVWPWCIAAVAGAGHLAALANPVFANGEFGSFLVGLAGVAFVTGVLVLSALPMGSEFHNRTFALLLSQPAERSRLWRQKLFASTLAVLGLAIVHGLASVATARHSLMEALLYLAFVCTAICSVGFYTLVMRSILMGVALAAGAPFAIALSFFLIVYYVLGIQTELSEQATIALIVSGCAVYSSVLLWFNRRQFAQLELKDGPISRAAQIPEALVPRMLTELFRAQPAGAMANLIRKEVCLQKPIFLVSAIFTVCWLLTLLLMPLRPAWHDELVGTLYGLTGTQMVLMVILSGCVSLGDDKALGTTAWHLTLPVSTRQQWFIKLFVAAATLFAMAFVLPTILSALTLFKIQVGLLILGSHDALVILLVVASVFLVSFWSASLASNTVRAAIATVVALIVIPTCVFLGAGLSQRFMIPWPSGSHSLQSGLVTSFLAHYQLPPEFLAYPEAVIPYCVTLVVVVVLTITLMQSLAQFHRAQTSSKLMIKYATILAMTVFAGSFWCADMMKSVAGQEEKFVSELRDASCSHQRISVVMGGKACLFTSTELAQTGKLSPAMIVWLRDAQITLTPVWAQSPRAVIGWETSVLFPNNMHYSFRFPDFVQTHKSRSHLDPR